MSSDTPRIALDANVILRYLLKDHPELSEKARAIWQSVEEGNALAVCDPVIVAEVVFVMRSVYDLPNAAISQALIGLLQPDEVILVEKPRYLRALRLFGESVGHFGDACACAAALEDCDGRLYSFDRKLSSAPGIERLESPE